MKHYIFIVKRSKDKEPWVAVYKTQRLAEECPDRVSTVLEIDLEPTMPPLANFKRYTPAGGTL
jgi:hypothetical protein